jgi:hypothetical protein
MRIKAAMRANWESTPAQKGIKCGDPEYNKKIYQNHLPTIIQTMVSCHIRADFKAGRLTKEEVERLLACNRDKKRAISNAILDVLVQQKMLCAYSGRLMIYDTSDPDCERWRKFSLERLDNSKTHFSFKKDGSIDVSNLVAICRNLNTASGGMSRRKWIILCLCHAISSERRRELYNELVAIRKYDPKGIFHHSDDDLCMTGVVAPKALDPQPIKRRTPVDRSPKTFRNVPIPPGTPPDRPQI